MVNMATTLVIIFIHNTNAVVASTRSNRRTHRMAKLRKQRLASSILEIRSTGELQRSDFFHFNQHRATDCEMVEFHQISRTDMSECRALDGWCRQYTLSHAHFSQFSQSWSCLALYMTFSTCTHVRVAQDLPRTCCVNACTFFKSLFVSSCLIVL